MFFFLLSLILCLKTARNTTIKFSDKSIRSGTYGWCFVEFKDLTDDQKYELDKNGIKLTPGSLVTKHIHELYLTKEQVQYILANKLGRISEIISGDKIFLTDDVKKSVKDNSQDDKVKILVFGRFPISKIEKLDLFEIIFESQDHIIISTSHPREAATYLSEFPEVESVQNVVNDLENNIATGFTQNNNPEIHQSDFNTIVAQKYINEMGIDGKGEVITIIDSFMDPYHAFFYEENSTCIGEDCMCYNGTTEVNQDGDIKYKNCTFMFNQELPNHRKFVYFHKEVNDTTYRQKLSDHGTNVAGIVAGKSYTNETYVHNYNGMAPEAKIFYAGSLNEETNENMMDPRKLAKSMRELKSYISTNSWGSKYDKPTTGIWGNIAYNNQDLIFIFSAGNYGLNSAIFSVHSPKNSKNLVAVGAQDTVYKSTPITYINYNDKKIYLTQNMQSNSSTFIESLHLESELKYFNNLENSTEQFIGFVNIDNLSDEILYYTVNFVATNYYRYNFVIFYSANINNLERIKPFQSYFFYLTAEESILGMINETILVETYYKDIKIVNEPKRAYYSSMGPTTKGLLKPDVIAPGTNIYSSYGLKDLKPHGGKDSLNNDIALMTGTSMATPNAAGATLLIRQYYGNYNIIPDGNLLKASLIGSSSLPKGQKQPNIEIGHGLIDLSSIIPKGDEFQIKYSQSVVISNDEHLESTIEVNGNSKQFNIVLSYCDAELNDLSYMLLDFDIDLVIISPSGKVYTGNHKQSGDTEHITTNEKVILFPDEIEIGKYQIHVFAKSAISETANFSIFAVGNFAHTNTIEEIIFKSTKECMKSQYINSTKCDEHGFYICDSNTVGIYCQNKIISLNNKDEVRISAKAGEYYYLRYDLDEKKIIELNVTDLTNQKSLLYYSSENSSIYTFDYDYYIPLDTNGLQQIELPKGNLKLLLFNNYLDTDYVFILNKNVDEKGKSHNKGVIIGVTISVIVLVILIVLITFIVIKKQRRNKESTSAITRFDLE